MKFVFAVLGLFTAFSLASFAQNPPKLAPTPEPEVVKISTNLIQVDVTVTDLKGKIIRDLRPEEIEIYENGEKQKISNFSFISALKETTAADQQRAAADKNIPMPQAVLRPDQVRRTIVLVMDDLALSIESMALARSALKKFVDQQMQDGDLVAIIRTGAGIGSLQQFTSDKQMLYAAIDRVRFRVNHLGGSFGLPVAGQPGAPSTLGTTANGNPGEIDSGFDEMLQTETTSGTLGALFYIIKGMSDLPGRKSVIFFSDGFSLKSRGMEGTDEGAIDLMTKVIDAANRSAVVIYTIDTRGLAIVDATAADGPVIGSRADIRYSGRDSMNRAMSKSREIFMTQGGPATIAKDTGGFSVVNSNDMSGGVRKILDDQSYYLVGYEPNAETFDPKRVKFNRLEIKVTRPGATVRQRSGFINSVNTHRMETATPNISPAQQQLAKALASPFAVNGITVKLNALFENDQHIGSYVRSLLHVDARDLNFSDEPNGSKKAEFSVLALSFGDNGQIIDRLGRNFAISITPDKYKKLREDGFVYNFSFPVKKPGGYQYRVAIRDEHSGKVGTANQFIQAPEVKKDHLTLSGLMLEALTQDQWSQVSTAVPATKTDPMMDTVLRRFRLGTILRYGLEVYGSKAGNAGKPNLQTRIRVFRDSELVLDGKPAPASLENQRDLNCIQLSGAVSIGQGMSPGDYILQIIVIDNANKQKFATQYVQFEVVE